MDVTLIISFVIFMIVFVGLAGFILHRVFVANTDGAIQRLDNEYADATKKQAELNRKLRQSDEELAKRRAEARELTEKLRSETEEETKTERDNIIQKARAEGEEIIAKAKGATETLRKELEKEMDAKFIQYSMRILNTILADHAKGAFNQVLVDEYLTKLKDADLSKIGPDVKDVEVTAAGEIADDVKSKISATLKEKVGRDFNVTVKQDKELGGGIALKFGSMALDGSLNGLIRQEGLKMQQEVDDRN